MSQNFAGPMIVNLNQAITTGSLTINDTGLQANGPDSGLTINPNGGSLTMQATSGNATLASISGASNVISAPITFASDTNLQAGIDAASTRLTLSGNLSGSKNIIGSTSVGLLSVTGSNSGFSGQWQSNVANFQIAFSSDSGVGAVPNSPTVNFLATQSLALSLDPAMTLNINRTIQVESGAQLTFFTSSGTIDGKITGNGGVLASSGAITLTNASSDYADNTVLKGGTITATSIGNANAAGALGKGSLVSFNFGGGTLNYTGSGETSNRALQLTYGATGTFGSMAVNNNGTGALNLSNTGQVVSVNQALAQTLNLGGSNIGNNVFSEQINNNSTGNFALSVVKGGGGKWIVNSSNSNYIGTTAVNAGTLIENGTHTGGGAYTVTNSGSKFGGSGSITATSLTMSAGTKLTPGDDANVGTLTLALSGSMDISAASNNTGAYLFDLGTTAASDKITLTTGTLKVGTLDFSDFAFTSTAGFANGTYTLFDAASAITGSIGTASGLIGSRTATLSIDGTKNDVILTVVPEPAGLAIIGLGATWLLRRRRQAKVL